MAVTIPPGPYDIVDVPPMGGAPTMTAEVINAMWNASVNKSLAGAKFLTDAMAYAVPAPQMANIVLDKSYLPPPPPDFPPMDPNNGEAIYDEKVREMLDMIQKAFDDFLTTYFPDTQAYEDAIAWCERAVTTGGSGINLNVEQALWQRDRARIVADSERATDEAFATWANRRFPLPPGTLTNQVNQINLDMGRKIAESSRSAAIKSFEAELENARVAVKLLMDQKIAALNAAGDYAKVIMLGPQTAMQLATGLSGLQTQYWNAMTAYYTAQVTAAQPMVQLAIADANLQAEVGKANLQSQAASVDSMVKAAMAGAQMMASQAASGINAINAQTSVSGQDSSQV